MADEPIIKCPVCGERQPPARKCRLCRFDIAAYEREQADAATKETAPPDKFLMPVDEGEYASRPSSGNPRDHADEPADEIVRVRENLPPVTTFYGLAWKSLKPRYATLLGVSLTGAIITIIAAGAGAAAFGLPAAATGAEDIMIGAGVMIVSGIIAFLALSLGWGAFAEAIADSSLTAGAAFRRALGRVHSHAWLFALQLYIVIGGLCLFVVPGVIFAVGYLLAPFVLASEGITGMAALIRANQLGRLRWSGIFGRYFAAFVPLGIASSIFPLVGALAMPYPWVMIHEVYLWLRANPPHPSPTRTYRPYRRIATDMTLATLGYALLAALIILGQQ
jgi:hypothetical protein